jgi:hypothetical protein
MQEFESVNQSRTSRVLPGLLDSALLLDLEVSHQGKLLQIGAVLRNVTLSHSGRHLN